MKLIITRPKQDAEALAIRLKSLGHEAVIVPLLEIVPRQGISVPPRSYQAICLTSANGIINDPSLVSKRVLTVGPQSAEAARAAGYEAVSHHGGDLEGLVSHIARTLKPQDGPLLYLSGATTSGDLEGQLKALGFSVDRIVTYDAVAIEPLDLANVIHISNGVLLYSPRSAKLWANAVEKANAQAHIQRIIHYCLSVAVAKALPHSWLTRTATAPDESALLATLARPGLVQFGEQE